MVRAGPEQEQEQEHQQQRHSRHAQQQQQQLLPQPPLHLCLPSGVISHHPASSRRPRPCATLSCVRRTTLCIYVRALPPRPHHRRRTSSCTSPGSLSFARRHRRRRRCRNNHPNNLRGKPVACRLLLLLASAAAPCPFFMGPSLCRRNPCWDPAPPLSLPRRHVPFRT